jgi:hypothetical protein
MEALIVDELIEQIRLTALALAATAALKATSSAL